MLSLHLCLAGMLIRSLLYNILPKQYQTFVDFVVGFSWFTVIVIRLTLKYAESV